MKYTKRFLALGLALLMILAMATSFMGCSSSKGNGSAGGGGETEEAVEEETKEVIYRFSDEVTNYVRINTKGYGEMIVELYPDVAPETVAHFQSLVKAGFYNKLTFHRIIKGSVIQGGDPLGTGFGGADTTVVGEFSANGFENTLSHTRGVISMARKTDDYNSASSQFFFCHQDATEHDGEYAAFGKVIKGIETLDKLAEAAVMIDEQTPIDPPEILSIRFVYPD